jgi:hypothetical protein
MDSTRSTVEMMTRTELKEAYDAYASGAEIGRLAARYGVYPAELQRKMEEMAKEHARRAESPRANNMGRLSDLLFDELERLGSLDTHDSDALKAEVERSRAIEGIAKTVIENAGTVLEATRMRAQYTQQTVTMPKLLEG